MVSDQSLMASIPLQMCDIPGTVVLSPTWIISFNPHTNSMRKGLLILLFYGCGNEASAGLVIHSRSPS